MRKKKQNHYSEEFKLRLAHEVLSGKYTNEEARKAYAIGNNCAILYWMRQYSGIEDYRKGGEPSLEATSMHEMKEINKYEQRIEELEAQLTRERICAHL